MGEIHKYRAIIVRCLVFWAGLAVLVTAAVLPMALDYASPQAAQGQTVPMPPPSRPPPAEVTPTPEPPPTATPAPTPVVTPTTVPTQAPTSPPSPTPPSTSPPTRPPSPTPQPTAPPLLGITLSQQTTALASDGAPLTLVSGKTVAIATSGSGQAIQFPVRLAAGQRLGSFSDPQSGLQATFSPSGDQGTVIIPLTIQGLPARMRIEVGAGSVQGELVTTPVRRVLLEAGPVAIAAGPEPEAALEVVATLRQVPEAVAIEVRPVSVGGQIEAAGRSAAERAGLAIEAMAYSVEIRPGGGTTVSSGTLVFTVTRDWLAQWPENSLRVLRIDGQGRASFLSVDQSGATGADKVRLQAESPEGFSTFAVVAVKAKVKVEAGGGSGMIIAVAGVAVAVVVVGGFFLLRRGKRPAA